MYKYNAYRPNNQACKKNNKTKFLNRLQLRSKAYKRLCSAGYNVGELYDWLCHQKKLDTIAYRLLNYVLFLSHKGMHAYPSVSHIQAMCRDEEGVVPHEKSICRVTRILADKGIIRKWYKGFKKSVALLLNQVFNNPILQYLISPLFPFMSLLSFNVIYPSLSDCRESFVYRSICFFQTDVTYNRYKEFILKSRGNIESIKKEILTLKGRFYKARTPARTREEKIPEKGMRHISSILGNDFLGQKPEFISASKVETKATPMVKKPFVLPEQPKTVGELLAMKMKEREESASNFKRPIQPYSEPSYAGYPERAYYPPEDESVWEDETSDDYS